MLPVLIQFFLYAFGLDAILSFWAELYQISTGSVAEIRMMVALSTLMQGIILYLAIGFSRRVSFRLIGWPVLFLLWANLTGCFPLPLFYLPSAGLWMASVQLVIAVVLVGVFWRSRTLPDEGGTRSGFQDPAETRSGFSWRRFFVFVGANVIFLPFLFLCMLMSSAVDGIERATAGYVRLRPSGLYITQSKFKKDAQEVALDGMMHVADGSFYQKMKWGVEGARTLVLLEGVSDRDELLKGGIGMERLAKAFGLDAQMSEGDYRKTMDQLAEKEGVGDGNGTVAVEKAVDVRRADVDVNTFRPQTIAYLKAVGSLFQAEDLPAAIKILQEKNSPLQNERTAREALQDILTDRNTYLIGEIEKGLETHDRVVVPWGAMHLAGIEQSLRSKGFVETSRVEKPAILFWKKRS